MMSDNSTHKVRIPVHGRLRRFASFTLPILTCMSGYVHAEKVITYYYTDQQGSVLQTTDANGVVLQSADYHPYGWSDEQAGPGYTGHVADRESTLIYMQARYYDPEVGRFLSIDPARREAGNIFDVGSYTYGRLNPVRYIDPDGRKYAERWAIQGAAIGAATGVAVSLVADVGTAGVNLPLTPVEIGAGTVLVGGAFAAAGAVVDLVVGDDSNSGSTGSSSALVQESTGKTPNSGAPGSVYVNPGSGQVRVYGSDGKPLKDIDYDHDHGQGVPHVHDWDRKQDGTPDRQPGRPYDPEKDNHETNPSE